MNNPQYADEVRELTDALKKLLPHSIPIDYETRGRVVPDSELVFKSRQRVTSDGDLTVPDDAVYVLLLPVNSSNALADGATFDFDTAAASDTSPPIPFSGIQLPVRDINGMKVSRLSVTVITDGAIYALYFGY
jgi:hypothetical protein